MMKMTKTELRIIRTLNTHETHRGGQASRLMFLSQAARGGVLISCNPSKTQTLKTQ